MTTYRNHDPDAVLCSPHYMIHVRDMTSEDLNGKAEIAEELAASDIRIAELEAKLAAEKERADYAWRNTNTIEKARQEEMAKRDELLKAIEKAHGDICRLRAEGSDLTIASIVAPDLRAAIAKVKP
jgi:hypothetical protein